jgi:ssDNA-binding Zn-finger/Zn-ribbon topoisomerase 1
MAEQKTTEEVCAHCGEELGEIPIRRGRFVYCSEACAFEASRSVDCGGRTDTHSAPPIVEKIPRPSTE